MHRKHTEPTHSRSWLSQIALYAFPLLWMALLIVSFLKFNLSYAVPSAPGFHELILACRFIPIVLLALVFNVSNAIGFTYACVALPPLPFTVH